VLEGDRLVRAGSFPGAQSNYLAGSYVYGKTIGLVGGRGRIGRATARRAHGFSMRILYQSRQRMDPAEERELGATYVPLDELLRESDFVSLHAAMTPETHHLIGARELGLMKSDAVLVNLARGEIVDERALYDHLVSTPGFTACPDAWWVEPVRHGEFRMDHPFMRLPNVIGSPHNSASVRGWGEVALRRAVANCRRAIDGLQPLHLVGDDERGASLA
jgi:glyoxylate reductase